MLLPRDFFIQDPSLEAASSSCCTTQIISFPGVRHLRLCCGKPTVAPEGGRAPKSECVCEQGVKRGTCQLTAKGLWSEQLKSQVVCVRLLELCVNAWAAASPVPLVFHLLFQTPLYCAFVALRVHGIGAC